MSQFAPDILQPRSQETRFHVSAPDICSSFSFSIQVYIVTTMYITACSFSYCPPLTFPQKHVFCGKVRQDGQFTYNVKLWRVGVTIVSMERQNFLLCVLLS
jgi:hypothetical protein